MPCGPGSVGGIVLVTFRGSALRLCCLCMLVKRVLSALLDVGLVLMGIVVSLVSAVGMGVTCGFGCCRPLYLCSSLVTLIGGKGRLSGFVMIMVGLMLLLLRWLVLVRV